MNDEVVVFLSRTRTSIKTLTVHDNDYDRAIKLLSENGIDAEPEEGSSIPFLRTSTAKPNEKPASYGGIWANDERTRNIDTWI